ncbi:MULTISPECIES: S1C family serine protease [Gordonibacter]|uniref:Trypsin-like peptidase domain-containing protein n=1 Tax=Gordonibacter faecis TaxID=3047475 RepID=A0ABT7DNI4_9ACTN|nr:MULTISPECIES: trypsin-like peptidase domain-containing protein [unclassified Gordonibacter]MDJ1649715.1 trypsin-like peptidase domain-containing protein [Gordonibacter sp. KGMB12511]HIW76519.1 trypsin-like peptidase domain-containing protein [Candidatus Gordonibacter avicola]
MTDTQGTTPGGTPVPPAPGDEHAQHAATSASSTPAATPNTQTGYQQSYYQQTYQPPQPGHTPGKVTVEKKSHGLRTFLLGFAGAALACVIGLGGFGIWQAATGGGSSADNGSNNSGQTQLGSQNSSSVNAKESDSDLTLPEAVAKKALPSVVAIDVYSNQSASGMYGFGMGSNSGSNSGTLTQSSLGSGVVLTDDGYIITNYHVVEGGDAFKVTIEGEQYDAEIVGSDPSSDIAVIKAKNASGLTAVEIGDSDDLIIGEWVMTIGSPFGLEQSVATGIVSATSRSQIMDNSSSNPYGGSGETTIYPNMIQTDAAINPGNSGGALVDSDGKLIGINTLITSYSGNYSGVGFAIPVNYAVNLAQQIIDGKTPTHAQLGVSLSTVNAQNAQRYGLPTDSGAYVAAVNSGSGAAEAGLEVGDIITKFDGKDVTSASDLMLDVRSKNPGDKVKLEVNRNGQTKEIEVTLGSDESTQASTQQNNAQESMLERLFGGSSSNQDAA